MLGIGLDHPPSEEVDATVDHVRNTVGTDLAPHPGGWPGETEKALIDAIFSARAGYGSPGGEHREPTGVYRVLAEWQQLRGNADRLDDLTELRAAIGQVGFDLLHGINHQRVPGNASDRPTKWQAVDQTASSLTEVGVTSATDVTDKLADQATFSKLWGAFVAARGVGDATFSYFLMLLGHPGVKADTMVRAFVDEALNSGRRPGSGDPSNIGAKRAQALLLAAADRLAVDVLRLDHAAWNHQRDARRAARR